MRFTLFSVSTTVALLATSNIVFARSHDGRYHRTAVYLNQGIGNTPGLSAWALYASTVQSNVIPHLENPNPITVIVATNDAWYNWSTAEGADHDDPNSMLLKEFNAKLQKQYPYSFLDGHIDIENTPVGETVIFQTAAQSPAGDWKLPMAFTKEPEYQSASSAYTVPAEPVHKRGLYEVKVASRRRGVPRNSHRQLKRHRGDEEVEDRSMIYNGTMSDGFGRMNITTPDISGLAETVKNQVVVQAVNRYPTLPTWLNDTIASMNVPEWAQIEARSPAIAELNTRRDFTLFLPPATALSTALQLSDAELESFVQAHLVQGQQLILNPTASQATTASGASLSGSTKWVTIGAANATVISKNRLTSGGLLHIIDRALVAS